MSKRLAQVKVAASILAADFRCLREEIAAVEQAGADLLHLDVMDGSFVPNISFGPMIVEAVNKMTDLPLDVHLMIQRPDIYLEQFAGSGADLIVIHHEARAPLERTLRQIRDLGCGAGMSINPTTPLSVLEPFFDELNHILLMSVNPGFGGQKFIPAVAEKITKLREALDRLHLAKVEIAVDGGVNASNARLVIKNGAHVVVAGSAIFRSDDYGRAIRLLRGEEDQRACSKS